MFAKATILVLLIAVYYAKADTVDCFEPATLDAKVEEFKGLLKSCKAAKEESDDKFKECLEEKCSEKLGGDFDIKKILKMKLDMAIAKQGDIAVAIIECKEVVKADPEIKYKLLTYQKCLHNKLKEFCNLPDMKKLKEEVLGSAD